MEYPDGVGDAGTRVYSVSLKRWQGLQLASQLQLEFPEPVLCIESSVVAAQCRYREWHNTKPHRAVYPFPDWLPRHDKQLSLGLRPHKRTPLQLELPWLDAGE